METATFISVVNDYKLYEQCVRHNPFVEENPSLFCVDFDNTRENLFITLRYNSFLNSYNFNKETWFIFCHNDWEIKENIIPKLAPLDKGKLYGPIGVKLYTTKQGSFINEFCGACYEKRRDGTNERLQKCKRTDTGTIVDSFDCQCLIVHSSLVKQYNLRFDENLEFDLYVEDFCFNAYLEHGIESNIVQLDCCHWSQLDDVRDRPSYIQMLTFLNSKYKNYQLTGTCSLIGNTKELRCKSIKPELIEFNRATLYKHEVDLTNSNNARVITGNYIIEGSTVLDVGCAYGDLGIALHRHKQATVVGMEYNKESIDCALHSGAFENIHHVDLNDFTPERFQKYYGRFDYIIFGDVLEHIAEPQSILNSFKPFLKSKGEFLISFPNIAHASIKMNLLIDDWTYTAVGLLDKTHIKFFTYKSIPAFLAEIGLKIAEMRYTVMDRRGFQPNAPWKELPASVLRYIYKNPHSFIVQYVVRVVPDADNLHYGWLHERNQSKLEITGKNTTKLLQEHLSRRSPLRFLGKYQHSFSKFMKKLR